MNHTSKQNTKKDLLLIHSLDNDSKQINILPLDHTNPYDFKREHRHTYFEIILIEQGGCNQLIDFKNYKGNDYSCYIICPQQIHLMNRNNSSGTVVQFTEDRINTHEIRSHLRQLSFYEDSPIIFENRNDLFNELQVLLNMLSKHISKNDVANNQVATHLFQACISLALNNNRLKDNSVKNYDKQVLIDFYQLLEIHYTENVGVQYYIEKLGTTEKKLSSATKKHTGLSPLQVIHNRILLEAKRMLLFEETSHKEIAYQLGFDSPASFSTFIKSKTGLAPLQLTKHLAEIHK